MVYRLHWNRLQSKVTEGCSKPNILKQSILKALAVQRQLTNLHQIMYPTEPKLALSEQFLGYLCKPFERCQQKQEAWSTNRFEHNHIQLKPLLQQTPLLKPRLLKPIAQAFGGKYVFNALCAQVFARRVVLRIVHAGCPEFLRGLSKRAASLSPPRK